MIRSYCTATFMAIAAAVYVSHAAPPDFSFRPAGELVSGSGKGLPDATVHLAGMRFPIEAAPAFANSQVWAPGGDKGGGGSQCDTVNYSYPWRDNFCETRDHDMPLCPGGTGHQGQDIRPSTCKKDVHWVVSAIDGTVTNVGFYSVYVTADDGSATRTDYLHMSNVLVKTGDKVKKGQRLGQVSNVFSAPTTIHLHFNIRLKDRTRGFVFVSPYMSLVKSYEQLS